MSAGTDRSKSPAQSEFLDLLLTALEERQAARARERPTTPGEGSPADQASVSKRFNIRAADSRVEKGNVGRAPRPGDPGWEPPARQPLIHLDRALARFVLLAAVLVVLINIPLNAHGVSLARYLPDSSSLVIRDGLVLKGNGEEIYILQHDRLRWISSLDAFEHLGLTWDQVHVVEDSFLERFERGRPIHVLLKCFDSEHIYRLENGKKRWIKDIATFESEGHVWADVKMVDCAYLRSLPDGLPIPEDAGSPPSP